MKNVFCWSALLFLISTVQLLGQCFSPGSSYNGTLSKTTGNQLLDSKFNNSKDDIESLFDISVDLYVFNDGNSPNAIASQSNNPTVNGMVRFGRNLLVNKLWSMNRGEYAVAGILAHEFGHIVQIKYNCSLSTLKKELLADYLAGYYFGNRSFLSSGLRNFAQDLFSAGSYDFWDPNFHGTPAQRVNAMVAGYRKATSSIGDAYDAGVVYVNGGNSGGGVRYRTVTTQCVHPAHSDGDIYPCTHPAHQAGDVYPCQHPCTGYNGYPTPCHPAGHLGPCQHRKHYNGDLGACTHPKHPAGDVQQVPY